MIKLKFNRPLLLLALAGLILYLGITFLSGFQAADEETEANPAITKKEAAYSAVEFLNTRYSLQKPETFVTYQSKKTRSGYLKKENLTKEYMNMYGERYPIDYYQVEVLDRPVGQRYFVEVNLDNKAVLGWTKIISGADALTDRKRAEESALEEIRRQGMNPADFVRVSLPDEPVYRVVFEKTAGTVGEAKLQIFVELAENEIVGFGSQFSIPEDHQTWLENQDLSASVMTWTSLGATFAMTLFAIIYAIRFRREIDFSRGVLLTTVYVAIYVINNINMYPAFKTTAGQTDYGPGALLTLLFMNFVTLLMGVSLYFSLLAGNGMWQRSGWQAWPRWRDKLFGQEVLDAMGRGYLLCLLILGIQNLLFYIAEAKFGVWAVSDPSNSPYNMLTPGVFPLLAWAAAISEEAAFRLFGIILFKKLVRSNFLAVLIPSVIWAASHTQYAIYPVYTRLAEVTILGIVFGYAFLKYGFLTAVFAHACMDSLLMGLSLMTLNRTDMTLLGLLYIILPALIGAIIAWLHEKRRKPLNPAGPPPHSRLGAI